MTAGSGGPPPARLRRLSAEEIELWLSVAASVTRRDGSALPARAPAMGPAPPGPSSPEPSSPDPATAKPAARKPSPGPPLAPLERKLKQRLSRGRATADAAIDLHGFRQGEAHGALLRFLARAQRDGLKVVLVVTGKGRRPDDDPAAREGREGRRAAPRGAAVAGGAGVPGDGGGLRGGRAHARRRRRALRQGAEGRRTRGGVLAPGATGLPSARRLCRIGPMEPFTRLTGVAAPLPIRNVDTDQIIPARFLKTILRTGLGRSLFAPHPLPRRRNGKPGLRAQQAGLPAGAHPGGGGQLRLRVLARARALGASPTSASAASSRPASPTSSTTTASRTASCPSSSRPTTSQS